MNYKTLLRHLVGWTLLILIESAITRTYQLTPVPFYVPLVFYGLNIGLFYFCITRAFPVAFGKTVSALLLLPVTISGTLAVYLIVSLATQLLLIWLSTGSLKHVTQGMVIYTIYRGFYFLLLAAAYWFPRHFVLQKKVLLELENQQLQREIDQKELEQRLIRAQNAYLQSRLKPHLLFNSLNYLQDITYGSEKAAECIHLLSDILRYSIEEPDEHGTVALADEIAQIKNYIALNRLRSSQPLHLQEDYSQENPDARIIPLLLLSLVENIFHHGRLGDTGPVARLRISEQNGKLRFFSCNTIRAGHIPGTGLGIHNNRIRLENHYPGRFLFSAEPAHQQFVVHLELNLP